MNCEGDHLRTKTKKYGHAPIESTDCLHAPLRRISPFQTFTGNKPSLAKSFHFYPHNNFVQSMCTHI